MTRTFQKILVANRGEIALRVMRTCKEMGIRTVAVFSEADRLSAHARYADEAFCIGPALSQASYLAADRVVKVAQESGADAIHPGYGFLSENADFADRCEAAGLVFIGPPGSAIRVMGDKTRARTLMQQADVPVVPGTPDVASSLQEAHAFAERVGFPIITKAAAGGGGKGMRLIEDAATLEQSLVLSRSEAQAAFGDERVFIEKYLVAPRHIEVQILCDRYGDGIHLFERECSIQRRHQKVVEEAPSCVVTPELRNRMTAAALRAAAACGYEGAGTVEFLVGQDQEFYFMEMNTRLQVEHPVTEWITGLDLVAAQITVAQGMPLPISQQDLTIHGHAIECRVYAEDPANGFLPDAGMLVRHAPPSGLGVRVDASYDVPGEVSIHYDPMIAKLSTWGRTRAEAVRRMVRALRDYDIVGVKTTIPFCLRVMESEAFLRGDLSTHFVADHPELVDPLPATPDRMRAAAVAAVMDRPVPTPQVAVSLQPESLWRRRRC